MGPLTRNGVVMAVILPSGFGSMGLHVVADSLIGEPCEETGTATTTFPSKATRYE